ncbi:hypothetical protein ACNKHL_23150 [Shigella flexneri]
MDRVTICSRQWVAANWCGDGGFTRPLPAVAGATFWQRQSVTDAAAPLADGVLLLDIQPGDEVIMPSYTFVPPPMPFVLRGAKSFCGVFARTP